VSVQDPRVGPNYATFEIFYAEQYWPLVRYVLAFTGDHAVAEDLACETFAAAWRRWSDISGMAHPERWLRKVVTNKHTDGLRRKYTRARALVRLGNERPAPVQISERDEELAAAVARLSKRQAQVIALMYFEDRPADEIAEILGVKIDDVYKHHNRAKAQLRRLLGYDEP
jgi:RNA polymerase sigma-70 factor, ECF subfamily